MRPTYARTLGLVLLAAGLAAVPVAPAGSTTEDSSTTEQRPNILVVMTDDMRMDEIRYLPNVVRHFRDRGIDWRNSFASTPLCCPSRASFLTGRYTHRHRVMSHEKPWGYQSFDDSSTLAGALQEAGYRTGYVGKYLNGYGPQAPKAEPSRTHSWFYMPNGWTDWRGAVDRTPYPSSDPRAGGTYKYFDLSINVNGRIVGHQGTYGSVVVANHARAVIDRFAQAPAPWFLMVNATAPHHGGPHEPDDPGRVIGEEGTWVTAHTPARPGWVEGRFDDVIRRAPGVRADGTTEVDVSDKANITERRPELSAEERRSVREVARQRAEALFALDRALGRVIARLKRTGEYADTILVLTSDNGYLLGEHRWRQGKVIGFEPSYRVPLLTAGPGIPQGVQRFSPVMNIDLTATILDWADATLPGLDGRSVVPDIAQRRGWTTLVGYEALLLGHRRVLGPEDGFTDARTVIGVRTARYKYVRYVNGNVELFDLLRDPLELSSVATSGRYADVRRALERLWERFRDCRGPECRALLPESLQVGPDRTAELRRIMSDAERRYY